MDDLRVNVLFNSISVISGRWASENVRLVQWNPVPVLGRFVICKALDGWWMDNLRFYVLSIVFQSYQDDGRVIT